MNTYYYTPSEKQDIQLLVNYLSINFDFENSTAYPMRKYGAQSFVTYTSNNINIRRISEGNFYQIGSKELYCSEVCYLVNEQFFVLRNGVVTQVKQTEVLKNEPTR